MECVQWITERVSSLFGGDIPNLAENQDAERESGCSRLCKSTCQALIWFPTLLVGSAVLLGWNEKRAVCDWKAIAAGQERAVEVECTDPGSGLDDLVMFHCELDKTDCCKGGSLEELKSTAGSFAATLRGYNGTGLNVKAEMLQCVEKESTETKKDALGGGTTKIKTYTYSIEWKTQWVDPSRFHKVGSQAWEEGCGAQNPPWPTDLPQSDPHECGPTEDSRGSGLGWTLHYGDCHGGKNYFAEEAHAGDFGLSSEFVRQVPLSQAWTGGAAPAGWKISGDMYMTNMTETNHGVGQVRVRFKGTNWDSPTVTVLGKNADGLMKPWRAPKDWLCSGSTLAALRQGSGGSKQSLFEDLQNDSQTVTWICRFFGWLFAILAFVFLIRPLEVVADFFCGYCLEDSGYSISVNGESVHPIVFLLACIPGNAWAFAIIGIVWVAMRPMVGIPLLAIFAIVLVLTAIVVWRRRSASKEQHSLQPTFTEEQEARAPGIVAMVGPDPELGLRAPSEAISGRGPEPEARAPHIMGMAKMDFYKGPVQIEVAAGFIDALTAEYLKGNRDAVGEFFDSISSEDSEILAHFEDRVRDSADKESAIQTIKKVWRMCEEYQGPVDKEVAVRFIVAMRVEYVQGGGGAVGDFFDTLNSETAEALAPFEDRVRDSEDKQRMIHTIESEWGM